MFSDQRHILGRDIPTEIAVLYAVVFVIAIGVTVWGYRTRGQRGELILRGASLVLCVLGLAVSGYIAYKALIVDEPFQCLGGGGGCSLVEQSKYARFLGIHMSIYGLIGYLTILGVTVWKGDNARLLTFGLSLFGFIVSLLLRYLELWEIHASCQWCVASAVLMTCLLVVNSVRLFGHYGIDDNQPVDDDHQPLEDDEVPDSADSPEPA
ncbi:MAG: vitamin K epoxide reductase family protein [Solirubrobacterales bacterium]|nr:vitamin K epoxide reductase family protein [Solirubrobacterales bacterium]